MLGDEQRYTLRNSLHRYFSVGFACNGHQPGGGHRIQPHDHQRTTPGFAVPGFLHNGGINLGFPVLGVYHVEVAAVVSCYPDLASSDTLPSLNKRLEAFQSYTLRNTV